MSLVFFNKLNQTMNVISSVIQMNNRCRYWTNVIQYPQIRYITFDYVLCDFTAYQTYQKLIKRYEQAIHIWKSKDYVYGSCKYKVHK